MTIGGAAETQPYPEIGVLVAVGGRLSIKHPQRQRTLLICKGITTAKSIHVQYHIMRAPLMAERGKYAPDG